MSRLPLALLVAVLAVLPACGTKPAGASDVLSALLDGKPVARFGFGAEGGEKPTLTARQAGGFALAYVGSKSGNRHVYVATSADGRTWSKAAPVAAGDFADANPALAEDATGNLHLYFASNRAGDNQALYHVSQAGNAWGKAAVIAGFDGVQDVAACADDAGLTIACEVMGAGLLAASSPDGVAFGAASEVSPAGAEPAVCALPEGRALVAFQRDGKIWGRAGSPGSWESEVALASGASRLRDPALAWANGAGSLFWAEKGAAGFGLHVSGLDTKLQATPDADPVTGSGDARGAAIAVDPNGSKLLAWGMKNPNGQQGVMVTTR